MSFSFAGRYFNKHKAFFTYECKDYIFNIDLEYGELYFERSIVSFKGFGLPLEIKLKYVHQHSLNYQLTSNTGFPRGFKTNFHVFVEYDSTYDRFVYEDLNGFQHNFIPAQNSNNLYFDSFGSGLMLLRTENNIKVFDDNGNYQLFDLLGRLILINKHITSSYNAQQHIAYEDNYSLRIQSITDSDGRCVTFSYTAVKVKIKHNNEILCELNIGQGLMLSIATVINNYILEDSFNQINGSVESINLSSGETFQFTYSGNYVSQIVTNVNDDSFSFQYYDAYKIVLVTDSFGNETSYDLNNQQFISKNSDLTFYNINSDLLSCILKESNESREIVTFTFDNSCNKNLVSNSSCLSDTIENENIQSKKLYLFCATINGNLGNGSFNVQLYDADNNFLAELVFEGNTNLLSFPVGIKNSTNREYYLRCFNNSPNSVEITKAKIVPLIGEFEILCTDVDTGGPIFYYGDTPYYSLCNCTAIKYDNTYIYNNNVIAKGIDCFNNERQFYKRNNGFNFWTNDKCNLIANVHSVYCATKNGKFIGYDENYSTISLFDEYLSFESPVSFIFVKGSDNNKVSFVKASHNNSSFRVGYSSSYYEEEETVCFLNNTPYINYYDYDASYSLIELNTSNGYSEKYIYDSRNNEISKEISHPDMLQKIKILHGYDYFNNIVTKTSLVGTSLIQSSLTYDYFGNISLVHCPNNMEKRYVYDDLTGAWCKKTIFTYDNENYCYDKNIVDETKIVVFNTNNRYDFIYSSNGLTEVLYNNQTLCSISYYDEIDPNTSYVLSKQVSENYANGETKIINWDCFGRISTNGPFQYVYDTDSNLIRIVETIGNPQDNNHDVINISYNYFNEIESVIDVNNSLSVIIDYDDMHRIVSKEYIKIAPIYRVEYEYFDVPGLESVVKESKIFFVSKIICLSENRDKFNRIVKKTLSFGTNIFNSFSSYFNYCIGGVNNEFTNFLVDNITFDEVCSFNEQGILPFGPMEISSSISDTITYDVNGNVILFGKCASGTPFNSIQFIYDGFNRLIRENNPSLNKTICYSYDSNGNVLFKKEYSYTTSETLTNLIANHEFEYDEENGNLLIFMDGLEFEYDQIGNPIKYFGKRMSWCRGTLLSKYYIDNNNNYIELTYNGDGQILSKSLLNSYEIHYEYVDGVLLKENRGNNELIYLYSHSGIVGFVLNNFVYLYEKNVFNDIVAIRSLYNDVIAKYAYDAWGNHVVLNPNNTPNNSDSFIGNINPFRYRSYYYHSDLKFYWLNSRFYDSSICRFVSPDHYSFICINNLNGLNLYNYANNNPLIYYDPNGHAFLLLLLFGIILTVAVIETITDIINISQLEIKPDAENGKVKIINSHKIHTPWVRYCVSIYLNHINKDTKDIIKGSSLGVSFEWACHNIAYIFSGNKDAKDVDIGSSIFADYEHKELSFAMKSLYVGMNIVSFNRGIHLLFELIFCGGKK